MQIIWKLYVLTGRMAYWLAWPVSWPYLRRSRRTRVLVRCGDEILVVQNWIGTGQWNLPGGGLYRAEDPASGALRELREETGMAGTPKVVPTLLAAEPFRIHGFSYTSFYFLIVVQAKPALTRQKLEVVAAEWIKLADINNRSCGPDVLRALSMDSKQPL